MSILLAVYHKQGFIHPDQAGQMLNRIRGISGEYDDLPDMHGTVQAHGIKRDNAYVTLLRYLDDTVHLNKLHVVLMPGFVANPADEVATQHMINFFAEETRWLATFIDEVVYEGAYPIGDPGLMPEFKEVVLVFETKRATGSFDRLHDLFIQSSRNRLRAVTDTAPGEADTAPKPPASPIDPPKP